MANLPTVPQADIEEAIGKMNKQTLAVGENTFQQLKINTGLLQSISETLLNGLQLEKTRQALEKQREGLLIEAMRENARDKDSKLDDKPKGKKFSLEDLLGVNPGMLALAGIAAAFGALAYYLKKEFEDLATAIQGFLGFKVGARVLKLFKGLGQTLLAPFRALVSSAEAFSKSIKESKLSARFLKFIKDFKNMKFPVTTGLIMSGFLSLRNSILTAFGINPNGRQMRDPTTGRFTKGKMTIQQQIVDDFSKFFKRISSSLSRGFGSLFDDTIKTIDTAIGTDLKAGFGRITNGIRRIVTLVSSIELPRFPEGGGMIGKFFGAVGSFFITGGKVLGELLQPVRAVLGFLGGVVFDTIGGFFKTTGSVISGLFDFLGPVLKPLKSVLGIIGKFSVILTPFFALYDFIVGFWEGYTSSEGSVLAGLEEGLLEVFRGFFTKPIDLLREYIVAPFIGLFSKDAEKAVKDFSVTELFNSAYEGIKTFISELIGDPMGTIGNLFVDFPNPIDIVGEKLFEIFRDVALWINSKSFLPGFLASPFEFLAESVAGIFDLDKATGKSIKPKIEGNPQVGSGGNSGAQVAVGTQKIKENETTQPIVVSAPSTTTSSTQTSVSSQTLAVGASPHNSTPALGGSVKPL